VQDKRLVVPSLAASLFLARLSALMAVVALPLFVLDRYEDTQLAGLVVALEVLPSALLFGVVGRTLARYDARAVAIVSSSVVAASLAVAAASGSLPLLLTAVLLAGSAGAFAGPARMSVRAQYLAKAGDVRLGNGLLVSALRVPLLIGPALAGAVSSTEPAWAVGLAAGASFLSATTLLLLPGQPDLVASGAAEHASAPLTSVLTLLKGSPLLLLITISTASYMLGLGSARIYLLQASEAVGRPSYYGIALALFGLGGVLGGLLAGKLPPWDETRAYGLCTLAEGALWALLLVGDPRVASVTLLLAGVVEAMATTYFFILIQAKLPAVLNGAYFAALVPLNDGALAAGAALGGLLSMAPLGVGLVVGALLMVLPIVTAPRTFHLPLTRRP
jgi:MFS family permease